MESQRVRHVGRSVERTFYPALLDVIREKGGSGVQTLGGATEGASDRARFHLDTHVDQVHIHLDPVRRTGRRDYLLADRRVVELRVFHNAFPCFYQWDRYPGGFGWARVFGIGRRHH